MNTIIGFSRRFLVFARLKSEIDRLLVVAFCFNTSLLIFGIIRTGEIKFMWLVWNLFLGFIPYYITKKYFQKIKEHGGKFFWPVFITWLLFVPNSFYIITDLFHLNENIKDPSWYNLLIIFSFTWNGILLGLLSIRQMEKIVVQKWPDFKTSFYLYPVMFLNAFGIYIGRYLRFNTWDIIANPAELFYACGTLVIHPATNAAVWAMITSYTLLMVLIYNSIKNLSRLRW